MAKKLYRSRTERVLWGVCGGLAKYFNIDPVIVRVITIVSLLFGGATVQVWYDLMVENDGTQRPSANVQGISNGDRIIVTGELKGEGGTHYSKGDLWARVIVVPLQ